MAFAQFKGPWPQWGRVSPPNDHLVNEKRIRRLMRRMGLMPIYQKPNTNKAAKGHKIYPYLLRGLRVDRPNQVWCADITYLPMRRDFLYLVAILCPTGLCAA